MLGMIKKILRRLNHYANSKGKHYLLRLFPKFLFNAIIKVYFNRKITDKYDDDILINLYPAKSYGQLTYFIYSLSLEGNIVKFIKSILKEGMIALDIGANIGVYSLLFKKLVGVNGKVICFEPFLPTFDQLKSNFKLNSFNVNLLYNLAVSDKNGVEVINIDLYNDGENSLISSNNSLGIASINSVILDNLWVEDFQLKKIKTIDLIKIDVEGWEPQAIEGMSGLLKTHRPVVIMEFNGYKFRHQSVLSFKKLTFIGYRCYQFVDEKLKEISEDTLKEYYELCLDFIYVHNDSVYNKSLC